MALMPLTEQEGQASQETFRSFPPLLAFSHRNVPVAFGKGSQLLSKCKCCWMCETGVNARACMAGVGSGFGSVLQGQPRAGSLGTCVPRSKGEQLHTCLHKPCLQSALFLPLTPSPKSTHNLLLFFYLILFIFGCCVAEEQGRGRYFHLRECAILSLL